MRCIPLRQLHGSWRGALSSGRPWLASHGSIGNVAGVFHGAFWGVLWAPVALLTLTKRPGLLGPRGNALRRFTGAARCQVAFFKGAWHGKAGCPPLATQGATVKTQSAVGLAEQQLLVCHAVDERARQSQLGQRQREQQQLRGCSGVVSEGVTHFRSLSLFF
jgi:hypothetical protein